MFLSQATSSNLDRICNPTQGSRTFRILGLLHLDVRGATPPGEASRRAGGVGSAPSSEGEFQHLVAETHNGRDRNLRRCSELETTGEIWNKQLSVKETKSSS